MKVELSSVLLERMIAEAARAHPRECCGILLGEEGGIAAIVPADNVHPDPHRHFEIDPQALISVHRAARSGGPGVAGYYHSHPSGVATPSACDRAAAAGDGRVWAIVGENAVRFWLDAPDGFVALSYAEQAR